MSMGKQIFYYNLKNDSVPELKNYIEILKERHRDLDKRLKEGYTNYLTDKGMQKMKFEKASIKRKIAEIEQKLESLCNENTQ